MKNQPTVETRSPSVFSRLFTLLAVVFAFLAMTSPAFATDPDDITTVTTAVAGYWTAIKVVSIAVLLFVIGRRVLRKL